MSHAGEGRHRDAQFAHWCAEIRRECTDMKTLQAAANRALSHPEVRRDAVLENMIRSFVAERESALGASLRRKAQDDMADPHPAPNMFAASTITPSRAHVIAALERQRHQFEDQLSHFDDDGARETLARIESLLQRYKEFVDEAVVQRCRDDMQRLNRRIAQFQQQIGELQKRAIDAARAGDHDTAAWTLRRLSSIHAARPRLLPDARFKEIREQIMHASEEQEHREAARQLVARERAVAVELRKLAGMIHTFHEVARRTPHEDPAYIQAEADYRLAVKEIRSHDAEWLAGLILELETLLDELHDSTGRAEAQLDRFLSAVRQTLVQLQARITTTPLA